MSPPIASSHYPRRGRIWILGLCGTLGVAWLGSGCGENTEKVLSRVPTVIYVNATGGASGGTDSGGATAAQSGGSDSGGAKSSGGTSSTLSGSGGITTGGIAAIGGTSAITTGPLMHALNAPIGYAAVGGNGPTTGGATQPAVYVTTCDQLQTELETPDVLKVIVIGNTTIDCAGTPIDCTTAPANSCVRTCVLPCDSTTGDTTRSTYRFLDSAATDCSSLKNSNSAYTAATPIKTMPRNDRLINVQSNKTLLGLGPNSTVIGARLYLASIVYNVIIQNLNITNVNPQILELGDAITIDGANHVWVDHCNFKDVSDGFVDAPNGASYVTLSWNHFNGNSTYACSGQHNYANTIEGSTITFHHNYYDHTLGCSPKVSKANAQVHLFNNYWQNVLYYSIQVANGAQAILQSNYFKDSNRPYYGNSSCLQTPTCGISVPTATPNLFEGVSTSETQDTGGVAITPLPYTLAAAQLETDASGVPAEVSSSTTGSGPTLSP